MKFVRMSRNLILEGEETLVEEANETKCLCDEFKIEREFFSMFLIQSFLFLT